MTLPRLANANVAINSLFGGHLPFCMLENEGKKWI